MKFDVGIASNDLNAIPDLAKKAEDMGFDAVWTFETMNNPFLALPLVAYHTEKIKMGTNIAVAFPRSPMVTANIAWDLAKQSNGRFMLGLGTQIAVHVVKRFSAMWSGKPVSQLREYIESMRIIWESFQENKPLRYRGDYYGFGYLPPFFNPGPIEHPDIPIYIAGVGAPLCRLAGEMCQGFHVHPFHTTKYLRELTLPSIQEGADKSERSLDDVELYCPIFVVTGINKEEIQRSTIEMKSQIAFYASTPAYHRVLEMHGWADFGEQMNRMTKENKWEEMWKEVPDEILHEFAVVAEPDQLPYAVREKYDGLLDRVGYYFQFDPGDEARKIIWEHTSKAMS